MVEKQAEYRRHACFLSLPLPGRQTNPLYQEKGRLTPPGRRLPDRGLNRITKKDRYPLPPIPDLLDRLRSAVDHAPW